MSKLACSNWIPLHAGLLWVCLTALLSAQTPAPASTPTPTPTPTPVKEPPDPFITTTLHPVIIQIDALEVELKKKEVKWQGDGQDTIVNLDETDLQAFASYIRAQNVRDALDQLNRIGSPFPDNDPFTIQLEKLKAQFQTCRAALNQDKAAQYRKILNDAVGAIRNAKKPEDLDVVAKEFEEACSHQIFLQYPLPGIERERNQLWEAKDYVENWKSYLVALNGQKFDVAAEDLREVSSVTFSPYSRSEILAMANDLGDQSGDLSTLETKLRSADDITDELIQSINGDSIPNGPKYNDALKACLQGLHSSQLSLKQKKYDDALAALSDVKMVQGYNLLRTEDVNSGILAQISAFRFQLILQITKEVLNDPHLPSPNPDESPTHYLLRLAGIESKAQDWGQLLYVLNIYSGLVGDCGPTEAWLNEDINALTAYLQAEDDAKAGGALSPIESYRRALICRGRYFPASVPAARLKEMQSLHPSSYKMALEIPIAGFD